MITVEFLDLGFLAQKWTFCDVNLFSKKWVAETPIFL